MVYAYDYFDVANTSPAARKVVEHEVSCKVTQRFIKNTSALFAPVAKTEQEQVKIVSALELKRRFQRLNGNFKNTDPVYNGIIVGNIKSYMDEKKCGIEDVVKLPWKTYEREILTRKAI